MRKKNPVHLLFSVFILCSCGESEMNDYGDLTEKKAQATTERAVRDLTPVDRLNLNEAFDGLSASHLKLSETSIYTKAGNQILRLSKQDFSRESTIVIPEGRGPGEVINFNVSWFEVGDEGIALYDGNARKTMLFELDGTFRDEFLNGGYQVRDMSWGDGQIFYFQVMAFQDGEFIFYEVERNGSESEIHRRFQPATEGRNLLAYSGLIQYHNRSLYFAGRSEPVIRRYDLTGEGAEMVFSRAVIDDYDSDHNYETPEDRGGFIAWSYTDNVKFASEAIAVDDRYLYSVRHHNDEAEYKYLDLYSVEDGSYAASFSLQDYPQYIAVDDEYIYTIEEAGDTGYLVKYRMPEINF